MSLERVLGKELNYNASKPLEAQAMRVQIVDMLETKVIKGGHSEVFETGNLFKMHGMLVF